MTIVRTEIRVAPGFLSQISINDVHYGLLFHVRQRAGGRAVETAHFRSLRYDDEASLPTGVWFDRDRVAFERGRRTPIDLTLIRESAFVINLAALQPPVPGALQRVFVLLKPSTETVDPKFGATLHLDQPDGRIVACVADGPAPVLIEAKNEWKQRALPPSLRFDGELDRYIKLIESSFAALEPAPVDMPDMPPPRAGTSMHPLLKSKEREFVAGPAPGLAHPAPQRARFKWLFIVPILVIVVIAFAGYVEIRVARTEKAAAEQVAAANAAAEKIAAERIAAAKAAAERTAEEKIAAAKAAADKAAKEKLAAAEAVRIAAEKAAAEQANQAQIPAQTEALEPAPSASGDRGADIVVPEGNSPATRESLYRFDYQQQFDAIRDMLFTARAGNTAEFDRLNEFLMQNVPTTPKWPASTAAERRTFNERMDQLINRAKATGDAQALENAVTLNERFLQTHFGYSTAHLNLSIAQMWLGRGKLAIRPALHAIAFNPDGANGYMALGLALARTDSHDRAVEAFCAVLRKAHYSERTVSFFDRIERGEDIDIPEVRNAIRGTHATCPRSTWGVY